MKIRNFLIVLYIIVFLSLVSNANAKSFLDSIDEALDSFDKSIDDFDRSLQKSIDKINKEVDKTLDRASKELDKASDQLDKISKDIEKISDKVERTSRKVSDRINDTIDDINDVVNETNKKINDQIDKTIKTGNNVTTKVTNINSNVERVINENKIVVIDESQKIQATQSELRTVNNNNLTNNVQSSTLVNEVGNRVPSSDPETQFSEKALEAMAALGDKWAKLKLEEIRAKKFADMLYQRYQSISWLNFFTKLEAYSDYQNAKKYYLEAAERCRQYEVNNPDSVQIIEGIDQINESVLELKALFGDKKAKAQLELIRAKRAYLEIKYKYDTAGFIDKLKLREELNYAKKRYELAIQNYAIVVGKMPKDVPPEVQSKPNVNVNNNTSNNTNNTNISNNKPKVDPSQNEALKFVRERMEAAYKRYVTYLSSPNPNPQILKQYENEYLRALEEYRRISGQ